MRLFKKIKNKGFSFTDIFKFFAKKSTYHWLAEEWEQLTGTAELTWWKQLELEKLRFEQNNQVLRTTDEKISILKEKKVSILWVSQKNEK